MEIGRLWARGSKHLGVRETCLGGFIIQLGNALDVATFVLEHQDLVPVLTQERHVFVQVQRTLAELATHSAVVLARLLFEVRRSRNRFQARRVTPAPQEQQQQGGRQHRPRKGNRQPHAFAATRRTPPPPSPTMSLAAWFPALCRRTLRTSLSRALTATRVLQHGHGHGHADPDAAE